MLKKMILLSSASLLTGFHLRQNLKIFQESEDEGRRRKDGKKSHLYRQQIIEEKENDFNGNKR